MKRLLPYIFSLTAFSVYGQADSIAVVDSVQQQSVDSLVTKEKRTFLQTALRADVGKAVTSVAGLDRKWEGGIYLLFFDQFFVQGEYGQGTESPRNALENGEYAAEGTYYRLGGGYSTRIDQRSTLGFGVQYAVASYRDYGTAEISSQYPNQPGYTYEFDRPGLEARWIEFLITSESKFRFNKNQPDARINRLFATGFEIRTRFMSSYERFTPIDSYAVPGYGRTVSQPQVAVNVFVKVYLL